MNAPFCGRLRFGLLGRGIPDVMNCIWLNEASENPRFRQLLGSCHLSADLKISP